MAKRSAFVPNGTISSFNPHNFTVIAPKPEANGSWWVCSDAEFAERAKAEAARITASKEIRPTSDSRPTAREAFKQRNTRENAQLVRVMGRMRT